MVAGTLVPDKGNGRGERTYRAAGTAHQFQSREDSAWEGMRTSFWLSMIRGL
jgi:hypothetical protein